MRILWFCSKIYLNLIIRNHYLAWEPIQQYKYSCSSVFTPTWLSWYFSTESLFLSDFIINIIENRIKLFIAILEKHVARFELNIMHNLDSFGHYESVLKLPLILNFNQSALVYSGTNVGVNSCLKGSKLMHANWAFLQHYWPLKNYSSQ